MTTTGEGDQQPPANPAAPQPGASVPDAGTPPGMPSAPDLPSAPGGGGGASMPPQQPGAVPGYGAPATGPRTDGKATTSLVLGIIGVLLLWCCCLGVILGIPAVILGMQSRKAIAMSGGMLEGDGQAKAGIILGAIAIALSVIWFVIAFALGFADAWTSGDFS